MTLIRASHVATQWPSVHSRVQRVAAEIRAGVHKARPNKSSGCNCGISEANSGGSKNSPVHGEWSEREIGSLKGNPIQDGQLLYLARSDLRRP
jgi:hypothetical protein